MRERIDLERSLQENPGLKPKLETLFAEAYADARRVAAAETGLALQRFPETPVMTLDQIRDEGFLPNAPS